MNTLTKATLALLPLALLAAGAGAAHHLGAFREVPPGVLVGDRVIDSETPLGVWLDEQRNLLATREIVISDGEGFDRVELGTLGVELDVAALMHDVRERTAVPLLAQPTLLRDARAGEVSFPLKLRVDTAKAAMFLARYADAVHRAPINARLDLMSHARHDDIPGAELDLQATIARLSELPHVDGALLEIATKPIPASFRSEHIASVDVSKVLASFETTFAIWGKNAGRAENVRVAAKRIDGWLLAPGETFSFNDVVGPRTLEAGFTFAPEIVGDELETGVGGGTCQVASTLYAAALYGALDIVDRRNHGRPSAYTLLGLDATVAYGKVDLKLRNSFAFPLIIHAYFPKPTVLRVELLGADPQAKVAYSHAINNSEDFFRRLTYKPQLKPGEMVLHQKGMRGHEVVSRVVTTWPDGRRDERFYFSGYRPVPEVFWVGRDFDESQLPELPEGVNRVERRGMRRNMSSRAAPSTQQENG